MQIFTGTWKSEAGQSLWIARIPGTSRTYAFYKPVKGRRIWFLPCYNLDGNHTLHIALHILGLMEAMLVLSPACTIDDRSDILVAKLESGSETRWELNDWGFPWVFPIRSFKRC